VLRGVALRVEDVQIDAQPIARALDYRAAAKFAARLVYLSTVGPNGAHGVIVILLLEHIAPCRRGSAPVG
jgi:hypothetical protein